MASWWDEAYNAAVAAGFMYPSVFAEQMRVESADFDEDVIYCRYVNDAGAKGIGQIIPIWHPTVDPCDPEAALQYAANWMNSLMNQQGGRVDLALVYYNGGGDAVSAWESGQPWAESVSYVERITGQSYSSYIYQPVVESGGDGSGEAAYSEEPSLGDVVREVFQAIADAVTPQSDYQTEQV
jgi:hypothetical protein